MSFSDTWANASVDDQQPDRTQPPEPGKGYTVELTAAKALTAKSGKDFVILELKGLDGAAQDHEWSVLQGFGSEQQAAITKRVVRDLGVDIDAISGADINELDDALKPMIGRYYTVDVVQNGDYRNTYFRGPAQGAQTGLPAAAVANGGGGPGSAVDDDGSPIPF